MTEAGIADAIDRFAFAARQAKIAGFTGVTLHAAHGYLISQFLSPRTNLRTDRWGGTSENRSRFLFDILSAVRAAVGVEFPIGIKLNSSDFLAGGFTEADCVALVTRLNNTSLDLLELSGGSMEQPKMMGVTLPANGATKRDGAAAPDPREAYFLTFARNIKDVARMPVMVTGGFRSRAAMEEALKRNEADLIGLGRPLIAMPAGPKQLLAGEIDRLPSYESRFHILQFMAWNNMQLLRMGEGLEPDLEMSGDDAAAAFAQREAESLAALLAHRSRVAA